MVTINSDESGLLEVFIHTEKAGDCLASQTEAISRLISIALRAKVEPEIIIKQLEGIRCASPLWGKGGQTLSCADAIAKTISLTLRERGVEVKVEKDKKVGMCPECGSPIQLVEGCCLCKSCGYSKCG